MGIMTVQRNPHKQFVEILQDLNAVVWEMDAQTWRFTFVSERAERDFGYPLKDWYEDPTFWQDRLVHPDDRDWCLKFCSTASGACQDHAFLYRAVKADGSIVWINDVVHVVPDNSGRAFRMRGVMLDVTDEVSESAFIHSSALDYDSPELEDLRAVLVA